MKHILLITAVLLSISTNAQFNKYKLPKKKEVTLQNKENKLAKQTKTVSISAEEYYEKALDYKKRGLWSYALKNVENAISQDPANLSYRELRVHALFAEKKYDRCVEDLNFIIQAEGGNGTLYYILGNVEQEWGHKTRRKNPTAKRSMLDENEAYNKETVSILLDAKRHYENSIIAFKKAEELGYQIKSTDLSRSNIERLEEEIKKLQ